MRKGRKRRLAVFLGAAAVMVLLCTLSGCGRHATRGELIDWFQKNYTDAKLVVSREKTEEDNGWTIGYMAYLKDRPELVFQLQSRRVIVGGLREHHNFTDFDKVYGAYYFASYQRRHTVPYWTEGEGYGSIFNIEAIYSTPDELEAAAQELLEILRFFAEQTPSVRLSFNFTFQSPVCDPGQFEFSLGSDYLSLATDDTDAENAVRQKVKDLRSELAVWCSFYGLHPEWFSEKEMEQALAYTQTEDYGGPSPYFGAWNISNPEKGELRIPLVTPNTWSFSFAQLYRLLLALEWATLEGSETDFTFVGADDSTYALSYALWENEDGKLVSRCTKDGVPVEIDEGCFTSYSMLTQMTGVVLKEENITYRGPDEDGIARLPAGPGL